MKKFFFTSLIGFLILGLPWEPPYTYLEGVIILLGYILAFVPGILLLILILNRLINISFTFRD